MGNMPEAASWMSDDAMERFFMGLTGAFVSLAALVLLTHRLVLTRRERTRRAAGPTNSSRHDVRADAAGPRT
ncbi:hypothetical protein [Streptomyces sp. NPDC005125]